MTYLRIINSTSDTWCSLIEDDPVRPEIPIEQRVTENAEILVLVDEQDEPMAAVCIRYCSDVPSCVSELLDEAGGDVAVLYTIWSYRPGGGARLLSATREHMKRSRTNIKRVVTLSPQTAMAVSFHTKNGAVLLRENHDTVNFEYLI